MTHPNEMLVKDEPKSEFTKPDPIGRRDYMKALALAGGTVLAGSALTAGEAAAAVSDGDPKIEFGDAASDPAANGVMARNGTDIKAFTGGSLVNLSDIGGSNVPDWTEDGNSPQTSSTGGNATYTLSTSSQFVWVFVKVSTGGSSDNLDVQVNGDTANNYKYVEYDSSLPSATSEWENLQFMGSNSTHRSSFFLSGDSDGIGISNHMSASLGNGLSTGSNANVSSPITKFTLVLDGTTTADRIEVYTRDIG